MRFLTAGAVTVGDSTHRAGYFISDLSTQTASFNHDVSSEISDPIITGINCSPFTLFLNYNLMDAAMVVKLIGCDISAFSRYEARIYSLEESV